MTSPVSPEPSSGGGGCDAGLSGLALEEREAAPYDDAAVKARRSEEHTSEL